MKEDRWLSKYGNKMQYELRKIITYQQRTRTQSNTSKIPVIITFNQKLTNELMNTIKRRLGRRHLSMSNKLRLLNGISARISMNALRKLCVEECIDCIYLDRKVKNYLNTARRVVGSSIARQKGITGKGIGIAIIDTGIYPHPDLTKPMNRIVAFKDFVNKRKRAYDDNGHGTHVAGIAAGNGRMSKGKYQGQAVKANLIGVKVLDKSGSGYTSNVIRGIEWTITNRKRFNIRVINLSSGNDGRIKCSEDPLCRAASKAWKAGIVFVTAAGNNGPRLRTIGTPGSNPLIITVGAVNDRQTVKQSDDVVARFSSRGPAGRISKPDLVAPGVHIMSLRIPRSYKKLSGTSMATPIVSGAVALLLERNPKLKPKQVKRMLKSNAFKLRTTRNAQGAGEINIRFIRRLCL